MLGILKALVPDFSHIEESQLQLDGALVGHQAVLMLRSGYPFAGGTDVDLNVARRICAAEAIERSYVVRLKRTGEAKTSCGFAAGFEEKPTIFRAVCEAVERWAWSKWIDENYATTEVSFTTLRPIETFLVREFESLRSFSQTLRADDNLWPGFIPRSLMFNSVIGVIDQGIFPGSRVTTSDDKAWEHPLLEAWRHKMIFSNEIKATKPNNIFDQRIQHFGSRGKSELAKIDMMEKRIWPRPKLSLLKEVANRDGYFVWRAYCEDYVGWELGDVSRFIY